MFFTTTLITIYAPECVQDIITTPQLTPIQEIWKYRRKLSLGFIRHSEAPVLKIPAGI